MLRAGWITHSENNILQACSLSRRPMNSCDFRGGRSISYINDEIPNLSEEEVSRAKPLPTVRLILIAIDDAEADKVCSSSKYGQIIRISDNLGIIIVYDGWRYQVSAGGEVNNSRCKGWRLAPPWSTATTTADGLLNSSCIICNTVSGIGSALQASTCLKVKPTLWHQNPSRCGIPDTTGLD